MRIEEQSDCITLHIFMRVTCRMLHSLMVQVETYLTHNSFSRKRGGFKVKINGVQIYKVS